MHLLLVHLIELHYVPAPHRFFTKKIGYCPERDPALPYVRPSLQEASECEQHVWCEYLNAETEDAI